MGHRLTKIYTRTGDTGETSLDGQARIAKDDLRVEAVGGLDELNSAIGVVIASLLSPSVSLTVQQAAVLTALTQIQHTLFDAGGELALPAYVAIHASHITALENLIDQWNADLPPLKEFILPRGELAVAACHLARAICRRVERTLVALLHRDLALQQEGSLQENLLHCHPELLRYINRLSDLLFVAARVLARANPDVSSEVYWQHQRSK